MMRIREVIVVEGRYDQNTLSQVVDATIITLGGFQVFKEPGEAGVSPASGPEAGPHHSHRL